MGLTWQRRSPHDRPECQPSCHCLNTRRDSSLQTRPVREENESHTHYNNNNISEDCQTHTQMKRGFSVPPTKPGLHFCLEIENTPCPHKTEVYSLCVQDKKGQNEDVLYGLANCKRKNRKTSTITTDRKRKFSRHTPLREGKYIENEYQWRWIKCWRKILFEKAFLSISVFKY